METLAREFERIYSNFGGQLLRSIQTLTKNNEASRDILQETFIAFLLCLRKGTKVEAPYCYLRKTATRLAFRWIGNKDGIVDRVEQDAECAGKLSGSVKFGAVPCEIEIRQTLDLIFRKLDPKGKVVAVAWLLEGMNQSEISRSTGISRRTTKRRMVRIRRIMNVLSKEMY